MNTSFFLIFFLTWNLHAKVIEGMEIPDSLDCAQVDLPLKASGVRTVTFFKVKIFTLALYAKSSDFKSYPQCFELTYFRDFSNQQVDDAWDFQYKESNTFQYPEINTDLKTLQNLLTEIKDQRKERFVILPGKTQVFENGVLKGEILGDNFQKTFISLWTSEKGPVDSFKQELK
ncbi:MAG: chalcone isomerase family protein [Bacteriovoracaceae bacterium]